MDDGRPRFSVLGVNDDIALKTVLTVAVCGVIHVRRFGEGDDGVGRLVVNQNEVTRIDAADFTGFVVNHGF